MFEKIDYIEADGIRLQRKVVIGNISIQLNQAE